MKISQKLTLLFLANALIPIVGIGVYAYVNSQRALNKQIEAEISNTATRQVNKVASLVKEDYKTLNLFASRQQMRLALEQYNQSQKVADRDKLTALLKAIRTDDRSFRRIHLLNTAGTVVASSDTAFVAKDYYGTPVFQRGVHSADVSLFFKDVDGKLGHYLTSPITLVGKVIGVAVIEYQVDSYLLVTQDYADLGRTGESYLVAKAEGGKSQYLTPLRFAPDKVLATDQLATGADAKDYRGHSVEVVARDITQDTPGVPWQLVVKIDKAEVYESVYHFRDLTLAIVGLITVIVFVSGWYFARFITTPIQQFAQIVRRIRGGENELRVPISSGDEVGQLATAFNDLTTDLLESRARLIASVLSLSQGFIMTDQDGGVVTINDAARRLLHLGPDHKGMPPSLEAMFRDKAVDFDIVQRVKACFNDKAPYAGRDIVFEKSFYNVFLSPVIIHDEAIGVVVLISDETEQKQLERSRDEFFSIASHELRTPLTAIMGNSSMIQTIYADMLKKDKELGQMVGDIDYASQRMIAIVNDFLDVSSLELGKIVFKKRPLDLLGLANETIRSFNTPEILHGVKVEALRPDQPLPLVFADADRLKQVLLNLVSNGLKFTEKGSVTIGFKRLKEMIEVSVRDTGHGIADENKQLLFHKFQQAGDHILTRDTAKGTGLGLYIAKLAIEGMGGSIWLAETAVGKGTTFTFSVPVATGTQVREGQMNKASAAAVTVSSTVVAPLPPTAPRA